MSQRSRLEPRKRVGVALTVLVSLVLVAGGCSSESSSGGASSFDRVEAGGEQDDPAAPDAESSPTDADTADADGDTSNEEDEGEALTQDSEAGTDDSSDGTSSEDGAAEQQDDDSTGNEDEDQDEVEPPKPPGQKISVSTIASGAGNQTVACETACTIILNATVGASVKLESDSGQLVSWSNNNCPISSVPNSDFYVDLRGVGNTCSVQLSAPATATRSATNLTATFLVAEAFRWSWTVASDPTEGGDLTAGGTVTLTITADREGDAGYLALSPNCFLEFVGQPAYYLDEGPNVITFKVKPGEFSCNSCDETISVEIYPEASGTWISGPSDGKPELTWTYLCTDEGSPDPEQPDPDEPVTPGPTIPQPNPLPIPTPPIPSLPSPPPPTLDIG